MPFVRRPRPAGRSRRRVLLATVLAAGLAAACGDSSSGSASTASTRASQCMAPPKQAEVTAAAVAGADTKGTTLTLMVHDSWAVSDGVLEQFTARTGIGVEVVKSGDVGTMVSQAVLTAGNPVADVLYGIDNTFLCRGLAAGLFRPYRSSELGSIPADLQLDPNHRVTPIDVGDVCVNYHVPSFKGTGAPASLDDLINPAFKGAFVTENPDTSSPGLAFLLATISRYGVNGWEDYWRKLRANGVDVENGWEDAYAGKFVGGGGKGRTIVTSYATSPAAEVVYADPKIDKPSTAVLTDSCFRQVEFAGVLAGTRHAEAAAKLVDFLASTTFQDDVPLNMFVHPANRKATIPDVFTENVTPIARPLTMDPVVIEANRAAWTARWNEIVLR